MTPPLPMAHVGKKLMLTMVQKCQGKDKSGEMGAQHSTLESNLFRCIMWAPETASCRVGTKIYY
jgi:hypothetical protein